jgi:D-methionine transport system permease protein
MIFNNLLTSTLETLYMVGLSTLLSVALGLLLGVTLFKNQQAQFKQQRWLFVPINIVVNSLRSVPFIILMIALLPLTRILLGTSIGNTAAIIPLSIAATPFFARITENALKNSQLGLIEASLAFGATPRQIIWRILLPECAPDLVRGLTLTLITLIGYSAMAGAVGAGGLGNYAIQYGYQRFNTEVIFATVVVLIVLVQCIQWLGNRIAKKLTH